MHGYRDEYPKNLGATVAKFRFAARAGLKNLSVVERHAYGEAVEKAIRAKQLSEFRAQFNPTAPKVSCASGTSFTTGAEIHAAVAARQIAKLHAYPDQVRRARTPFEWSSMYVDAMHARFGTRWREHVSKQTQEALL